MKSRHARARAALLLLCTSVAIACSSIPKADAMRVSDARVAGRQAASVGVRVSGGHAFQFRVSNAAFEQALRDSLLEAGVFSAVVELARADYRLDVVLGDDRGIEGRELGILWSLSRADRGEIVWQELIRSKGKSFHFVGVVRVRRSIEMAAQENIRLGIEQLSRADLSR